MCRFLLLLCVIALGGCSYPTKYTDITGQGRSEALAQQDYEACQAAADYPRDRGASRVQFELAAERFRNCMTGRGWRMDRK